MYAIIGPGIRPFPSSHAIDNESLPSMIPKRQRDLPMVLLVAGCSEVLPVAGFSEVKVLGDVSFC